MTSYKESLNEALQCINDNITSLTERYINSADPSESYVEAIRPLLYQQSEILKFLKEKDETEL